MVSGVLATLFTIGVPVVIAAGTLFLGSRTSHRRPGIRGRSS